MCTTHSFDTFAEVLVSPSSPFAQSYKNRSVSLWEKTRGWGVGRHLEGLDLWMIHPWDAIPFRFPRIKVLARLPFFGSGRQMASSPKQFRCLHEESQLFQDYRRFLHHFCLCSQTSLIFQSHPTGNNFRPSFFQLSLAWLVGSKKFLAAWDIWNPLLPLGKATEWKELRQIPSLHLSLRMECVVSRIDQGTLHLSCPVTGVDVSLGMSAWWMRNSNRKVKALQEMRKVKERMSLEESLQESFENWTFWGIPQRKRGSF